MLAQPHEVPGLNILLVHRLSMIRIVYSLSAGCNQVGSIFLIPDSLKYSRLEWLGIYLWRDSYTWRCRICNLPWHIQEETGKATGDCAETQRDWEILMDFIVLLSAVPKHTLFGENCGKLFHLVLPLICGDCGVYVCTHATQPETV